MTFRSLKKARKALAILIYLWYLAEINNIGPLMNNPATKST